MRTQIVMRELFTLAELKERNPRGYEKAMDLIREGQCEHDWWEWVYTDFQEVASCFGWTIATRKGTRAEPEIYFSGFSSQGDGARFAGDWKARDVSPDSLKSHAPQDAELHEMCERMWQVRELYPDATGTVQLSGRYEHSGCTSFDYDSDSENLLDNMGRTDREENKRICLAEDDWKQVTRELMDWLYRQLEKEHDYRTGEEACQEAAEANGWEFDETGAWA